MTFSDWPWRHWRRLREEAQALRLNERRLSWRELCAQIDALAVGFHAQGVRDGDGVLLRAYNQPDALLAWLALLQCGARVLPLNPQLPAPLLAELLPSLGLRHALVLNGGDLPVALNPLALHTGDGVHAVAWREDRIASMTLTSGSTGLPKAAVHAFRAHLASAEGVLAIIPFAPQDDWLLSLPLFHVSGQGILWRWLLAGAGLTVRDKQPLPGREVRIVDGEVWLRSDSIAAGYWRDGQMVPLANADGWFATRDRGRLEHGRLTILGRVDNLFFSGGEGIQPEEVERVIGAHPWITQVFIVPQDDAEFGQRPVAVVECGEHDDPSALAGWCADKLARFQQPVRWLRLPESLKTGGIKISRRALRDWVNQQAMPDSDALDVQ